MCYCLDLRRDSKLGKILSNKIVATSVAIVQLVFWLIALLTMMSPPESVKERLNNSPSGTTAMTVIFILVAIAFSILLLVGIIKNTRIFIQVFLGFNLFLIIFVIIGITYGICTQPSKLGVSGFFSGIFHLVLDVLTYFAIRNYYLGLTTEPATSNQAQNQGPKGFSV